MNLRKLTTLLVVDEIETAFLPYQKLGYSIALRVPDAGPMNFAILQGPGELMLQTKKSLKEDLPDVAKMKPRFVLYADVDSLAEAKRSLRGARVIVAKRRTFYGATEAWFELPSGEILGLAEVASS